MAHALALGAIWVSLVGWAWALASAATVASLGVWLARGRHRPVSLELHEDGRVSWRTAEGRLHEGELGRDSFVSTLLVVLELKLRDQGRKWVVVMGDSTFPDDFRRLRVWLRWRQGAPQPGPE